MVILLAQGRAGSSKVSQPASQVGPAPSIGTAEAASLSQGLSSSNTGQAERPGGPERQGAVSREVGLTACRGQLARRRPALAQAAAGSGGPAGGGCRPRWSQIRASRPWAGPEPPPRLDS